MASSNRLRPAPPRRQRHPALENRWLLILAATGAMGSCCVLLGVLRPGSPFVAHGSGTWFFTSPVVPAGKAESFGQFLGIMLVYLGIAILLGAWWEALRAVRAHPHTQLRRLLPLLVAWSAPIILAPPLFSRDVYSYAAQGEMVTKGLNPYLHGPSALGDGSFLRLVDPLWRHAPAPYGPGWERLSGWVVQLSGHRVLGAALGFRLVALIGVILLAWAVPYLARSIGRDDSVAFVLGVLNPLVLLVLLGGSHNDALMVGALAGRPARPAFRGHTIVGIVLCAFAAEVKVPALVGAAFIGWTCGGFGIRDATTDLQGRAEIAVALLVVMTVVGVVSDLGWRWTGDVLGAGAVTSWLDPSTAAGLLVADAASALGYHGGPRAFVDGARGVGLAVATILSIRLLVRSGPDRPRQVKALGWSLLLFILLGPIIWPWYETWGFVFLAVVAEGGVRRLLVVLSAVGCFADVPIAHLLIAAATPVVVACWMLLAAAIATYVALRRPFHFERRDPVA